MKTVRFRTDIKSSGCVTAITPTLQAIEEIEKWNVDFESPDHVLTVAAREDFSEELLSQSLREAGYFVEKI